MEDHRSDSRVQADVAGQVDAAAQGAITPEAEMDLETDDKQYYVKLPLWKKMAFGSIDTANNFSWSYISSFLSIYLTDTLLIPAGWVSAMFLICRLWDAINDPIVGYIADRTRSRWGRYRPWIFFASAPLFISTALLFLPMQSWSTTGRFAYACVIYALVVLFYTMVNLTYGSLNAVLTQDPAERGSLASWRLLFAYIGSTVMTQLVVRCEPALSARFPGMGYFLLAVIFAIFCVPMQIFGAKVQKEVIPPADTGAKMSIFKQLRLSFKNRPFMMVCIMFLAQGFSVYGVGTINIYWFSYVLGDQNPMATFSLITLVPSMLGCFTSQFWSNKFKDKGKAIGVTYVAQAVLYFLQFFLFRDSVNVPLMYVLGIVVQYFAGMNMSLIYGMVPDTVEYSELITKGERMDGFLNTLSSFWNKVGITVGTAGAPLILELTGYVANAPQQTEPVILALDLMKWIMPAAFSVVALVCLFWYRLDYAAFDKLVAEINRMRPVWEAERKAMKDGKK